MVFSDPDKDSGIVQEARWLVGANAQSYSTKDITRNVNRWFDRAVSLIFNAGGRWQWDDSNQTDYPIAVTPLVSGQQDYTFDVSHLRVHRVEIQGEDGNWIKLKAFDPRDLGEMSVQEFQETDGVPRYYDVVANSLFLYPASNYDQDASLKVWFQRKASYFDMTDTTKEPGFAEIFHRYLSLGAAYDYSLKFNSSNRNQLREEIALLETEISKFYALRQPDEHITLKAKKKYWN
jgi:hypothetical protein